jgi:hypothetical protein
MTGQVGTVAVLWRGPAEATPPSTRNFDRLSPVFDAVRATGMTVVPILYRDERCDEVKDRLLGVDAVLVWVDPIGDGEDRSQLNAMLRSVATTGVLVSAHPDAIDQMGTKEVLYQTRQLGWGTDTELYPTAADFRNRFPTSLVVAGPRVLKQNRGNGGIGVWKVTTLPADADAQRPATKTVVRVQHAAPRNDTTEDVMLGDFMDRCEEYFVSGGKLIDQPFVPGVRDGMVRAYLVADEVVGFARQHPSMVAAGEPVVAAGAVLGMPSAKAMYDAGADAYRELRAKLQIEWVPGLCRLVGLGPSRLPLLWDADFLPGPVSPAGLPTYLLCEINVSSVLPFPTQAPQVLAQALRRRLHLASPS